MPKTVAVTLDLPTIPVGGTTQAAATMNITERDRLVNAREIMWTSSAPAVATVSVDGLVTGVSAGTAEIKATVKTVSGSATVTVAVPSMLEIQIDATDESRIKALPIGAQFRLAGPTTDTLVQKEGA